MKLVRFVLSVALLVTFPIVRAQPAAAASMFFPSADYCGWVYNDVKNNNPNHNGVDIWTNTLRRGMYPSSADPLRGFPVQLAAEGQFTGYYALGETGQIYGMSFYHPALDVSTFYWHMAPRDGSGRTFTQAGFVNGVTYPVGTFLGYQGNLSDPLFRDDTVHVHFTITQSRTFDGGSLSAGKDPSSYLGDPRLNGNTGSGCLGANNLQYRGPLPQSDHSYPPNFDRWYVIVDFVTTASSTQAELCALRTEYFYDPFIVYQYGANQTFTVRHNWSGAILDPLSGRTLLTDIIPGRVLFFHFGSDSSIQDYGFTICNYHAY